jgi:RHS repeat-associated protein
MQPSIIRPGYNDANLLERVEANLRGAAVATTFVTDIDYNAKGQRTLIDYGNGVRTMYEYDPLTFRLAHLQTLRGAEHLQDLFYTYDPAGNIIAISDEAQQTIYFNGQVVEPHCDYVYDALYRLIDAKGREHVGQLEQPETTWNDAFRVHLQHPHDGQAMRNYTEQYVYDAVGNFEQLMHQAANGNWTRAYTYTEASLIEPGKTNNRLNSTVVHPNGNQPIVEPYAHDAHGNMTSMPHLSKMEWDFKDQLQATSKQVVNNGGTPETTYYVYDATGQRVRKVTQRQAAAGQTPTRMKERLYLGGFEIYREYESDGVTASLKRETLHMTDDQQRIALVETRTHGVEAGIPEQLIRYQLGNHLDSASLEVDDAGQIISYEEYHPYGSTSYQAGRSAAEVSLKRYRYTGMERDEETGLNYHRARYYALWLGRWVSCDPIGLKGGINLFLYSENDPIASTDRTGTDSTKFAKLHQLFDIYNKNKAFTYTDTSKDTGGSTGRFTSKSGSTFIDITWSIDSPKWVITHTAGKSYVISEFDFATGRYYEREKHIEQVVVGTRERGFFERWGLGVVLVFESTVETIFGGSHANAPTHPGAKTYESQSYADQAKNVAIGVGVGKVVGKGIGYVGRKVRESVGGGGGTAAKETVQTDLAPEAPRIAQSAPSAQPVQLSRQQDALLRLFRSQDTRPVEIAQQNLDLLIRGGQIPRPAGFTDTELLGIMRNYIRQADEMIERLPTSSSVQQPRRDLLQRLIRHWGLE